MKLAIVPKTPREYNLPVWTEILRSIESAVNMLAEGKIVAHYTALTSAPTTGSWKQGDFVKNSTPSELGSASSKYVITGWICSVSGTPGTWLQSRTLTGN